MQWIDKQIKRLVILSCCMLIMAGLIYDGLEREQQAKAIKNLSACHIVLASELMRIK